MVDRREVLSRVPEKLHKHLSVLSKKDLNRHRLFHISDNDRIREFIPRVTDRTLASEDRSVSRIACSTDLAGAIAGHSGTEAMFEDLKFNGIFTIYALPFEFCVKPNGSLVSDGIQTREHWLISYGRETEVYVPVKLGCFFYESIRMYRPKQEVVYEMIVEVLEDDVYLTPKLLLDKGYWRVIGRSPRVFRKNSITRKPMTVDSMDLISKEEWLKLKENTTVTLETIDTRASMCW